MGCEQRGQKGSSTEADEAACTDTHTGLSSAEVLTDLLSLARRIERVERIETEREVCAEKQVCESCGGFLLSVFLYRLGFLLYILS
jgi:hypothetical protein